MLGLAAAEAELVAHNKPVRRIERMSVTICFVIRPESMGSNEDSLERIRVMNRAVELE